MATTSKGGGGGLSSDDQSRFFPVPNITVSGLAKSGKVKVKVNNEEIVLVSNKGAVHAVQAKCPHQGGPLVEGDIEDLPGMPGCVIRCPLHWWKFNVISGECIAPAPNPNKRMKVYPVRIMKDEIEVGFRKTAS